MTLSEKDKDILFKIQKILSANLIRSRVNTAKKGFSRTFVVSTVNDCSKLANYFDGYIFGDKKIDFDNWKIGLHLLKSIPNNTRITKADKDFIYDIRPRQNRLRRKFKFPSHLLNQHRKIMPHYGRKKFYADKRANK